MNASSFDHFVPQVHFVQHYSRTGVPAPDPTPLQFAHLMEGFVVFLVIFFILWAIESRNMK